MSEPAERPRPPSADELRPRPQYGEYATPEEQRARIKQPDTTWLLDTGQDPDALHGAAAPAAPSTVAQPGTPVRQRRVVDRVITVALLIYGLVNVVITVPSMLDYDTYLATILGLLGVDAELADPSAGRPWAIAAAVVLGVGWLLTAYLSWRSLARGRITWWIPLLGAVVFTFVSGTLLVVPIASDPSVWNAILDTTR